MSKLQRIRSVLAGLVICAFAGFLLLLDDTSMALLCAAIVVGITLLLYGVKELVLYLTMARHMVGGKVLLYVGIITLDAGMFVMSLIDEGFMMAVYLAAIHIIGGALTIFQAMTAKGMDSPWKLDLAVGAGNILLGVACVLLRGDPGMLVLVYSGGLIYNAITRIVAAFKPQNIVYIQ